MALHGTLKTGLQKQNNFKKNKLNNLKKISFLAGIFLSTLTTTAQLFIDKATIEYEVKANIKKNMGNGSWEEMMKDKLPTFKTGYYSFTFADNKSIYKFDHWPEKDKLPDYMRKDDESNTWYFDHNKGKMIIQKNIYGSAFNIEDSILNLQWTITNENRNIAGFNCKKAVAKIFDSVYVFAFYTDEIMISGGPCSINGLPGMIMGLTIPRLFTSWIATKVSVNNVAVNTIQPTLSKKYYTMPFVVKTIEERTKDWYSYDEKNDENLQQKNRFVWNMRL